MSKTAKRRLLCRACGNRRAQMWAALTTVFIRCPDCGHQVTSPPMPVVFLRKDGAALQAAMKK